MLQESIPTTADLRHAWHGLPWQNGILCGKSASHDAKRGRAIAELFAAAFPVQRESPMRDYLADPSGFLWMTGIEDTFIACPSAKTGRTLDEYELTGHYRHWQRDFSLLAGLGVKAIRYGVPWYRINPAPGRWDFSHADATLERLLELEIEPIVDLVHYGVPDWIEGAFLNPDFDRYMAEYAARLAYRFKDRIRHYTPLNEPRITAWYCGKLGLWPPYGRGWRDFVRVMLGICRGIVRTEQALHEVDPEIVDLHVDATDLYETPDPALNAETARRQEMVFLALDLVSGKVSREHPLFDWMLGMGASAAELEWFWDRAIDLDLVGINLYPLFSKKVLKREKGHLRVRMPYAPASIVEDLGEQYFARYGRPIIIAETASEGSVERRLAWLDESVAAVTRLRRRGIPIIGYTWWPMFALVTWAYRQGNKAVENYLKQMGLWDLVPRGGGELERVATPLVEAYRDLVKGGVTSAGPLLAREQRHVS